MINFPKIKWDSTTFIFSLFGSMGYDFYKFHYLIFSTFITDIIIGVIITLFLSNNIYYKILDVFYNIFSKIKNLKNRKKIIK